ncbi:hypothetical protein V498_00857 [Pseudogymnoascus sp. VKM F-4517 (FW-2822)]|nr:hypothetical protein V498_00857 [Pseudogymnoascus sp. VKM F-4517 (FW-2822)]
MANSAVPWLIGVLPSTICQGVLPMTVEYVIAALPQAPGLSMGRDHEMALAVGAIWDPRSAKGLIRTVAEGAVGGETAAKPQGQGQSGAGHMTKAPNDR